MNRDFFCLYTYTDEMKFVLRYSNENFECQRLRNQCLIFGM